MILARIYRPVLRLDTANTAFCKPNGTGVNLDKATSRNDFGPESTRYRDRIESELFIQRRTKFTRKAFMKKCATKVPAVAVTRVTRVP